MGLQASVQKAVDHTDQAVGHLKSAIATKQPIIAEERGQRNAPAAVQTPLAPTEVPAPPAAEQMTDPAKQDKHQTAAVNAVKAEGGSDRDDVIWPPGPVCALYCLLQSGQ